MATKRPAGIKLITDETANKRYVQIDLVTLAKEPEAVEEYLDGLIACYRRTEPVVEHAEVVKALRRYSAKP